MNRRQFIQHASMLSAAAGLFSNNAFATSGIIDKIGVQLWSLPKMLESDFSKAIEALSAMGYKEIEMYGPYPFSTSAAQKRFQDIVPMLGFSGSGYFGYSADEIKQIFLRYGMTVPSIHTDLDTLQLNMEGLLRRRPSLVLNTCAFLLSLRRNVKLSTTIKRWLTSLIN